MNNNLPVNYYILVRYLASSWKKYSTHNLRFIVWSMAEEESVCGLATIFLHDHHPYWICSSNTAAGDDMRFSSKIISIQKRFL